MEKVVLGFSGGLDTTFCVKYLTEDKGLEVHSVIVNTGGFSEEELKKPKKGSALKYADKKKLAIIHAQYYLEKYNPEYIDFFNNNKKKDDLSDSYLQGLYWYKQIKK